MLFVLTIGLIEIPAYCYASWRLHRLGFIRWWREASAAMTIAAGIAIGGVASYVGFLLAPNLYQIRQLHQPISRRRLPKAPGIDELPPAARSAVYSISRLVLVRRCRSRRLSGTSATSDWHSAPDRRHKRQASE